MWTSIYHTKASKYFSQRTTGGARWSAYARPAHLHNQVAASAAAAANKQKNSSVPTPPVDGEKFERTNLNFPSNFSFEFGEYHLIHSNFEWFNLIAIPLTFYFEKELMMERWRCSSRFRFHRDADEINDFNTCFRYLSDVIINYELWLSITLIESVFHFQTESFDLPFRKFWDFIIQFFQLILVI